jgi:hypothetical protein
VSAAKASQPYRIAGRPRGVRLGLVAVLSLHAAACATAAAPGPNGREAVVAGGERGLGIVGSETPAVLKAAAAAPYALAAPPDCAVMAREITGLDELLGPDVDVAATDDMGRRANRALGGALRSAIPYRWVMRWVTQAGRMDRDLRAAILAGTARRGFLKGVRQAMACDSPSA